MLDIHHLPGSALEEKEIHILRRHPVTLLPLAVVVVILFLLPVGVYVFLRVSFPAFFDAPATVALAMLGGSLFLLFAWLFVFQNFIEYWLDIFILTDKRILDIDQKGLFGRTVSELRLYRIQDVTAEVKGFWRTMMDYGDIFIQTAGEMERFHYEAVAHPNQLAKMILEFSEADRKKHLDEAVEEFGMPDKGRTPPTPS